MNVSQQQSMVSLPPIIVALILALKYAAAFTHVLVIVLNLILELIELVLKDEVILLRLCALRLFSVKSLILCVHLLDSSPVTASPWLMGPFRKEIENALICMQFVFFICLCLQVMWINMKNNRTDYQLIFFHCHFCLVVVAIFCGTFGSIR